jgi:phosphoribosyl-AMP cyclohydrolase
VDDAVRARVERYELDHPPGGAELEDFVADFGKVRNASLAGDELGLRLAAQGLASLCPSVLRLLNPEGRAGSRREAFLVALDFPIAPDGYREDMLVCLGLLGRATTPEEVYGAAHRLVRGAVALLRPYADRLAPHLQPYLPRYLADGTLERYLE